MSYEDGELPPHRVIRDAARALVGSTSGEGRDPEEEASTGYLLGMWLCVMNRRGSSEYRAVAQKVLRRAREEEMLPVQVVDEDPSEITVEPISDETLRRIQQAHRQRKRERQQREEGVT